MEGVAVFVMWRRSAIGPYRDILLETLIELLTGIRDHLEPDGFYRLDQGRARIRQKTFLS
jgi:hypothetical protein